MKIRQIEAFRAVMETGSVTRAGEVLCISQPAVSKLLSGLATDCGFPLFVRTGNRLVPTPEARLLSHEVERLFDGTERIAAVAQAIREGRWGEVSLAAFPALAHRFVPRALAPLLAERVDVRLSLQSRTSPRVLELMANQQMDLGLSLLPMEHPYVAAEIICRFAFACAMPADDPLVEKDTIEPDDLRDRLFISLGKEDRSQFVIEEVFHRQGLRPQVRIAAQMAESACAFVAEGLGVAIVPPFVGEEFASKKLVIRPFSPVITMDIWLMFPASREASILSLEIADKLKVALQPYDVRVARLCQGTD